VIVPPQTYFEKIGAVCAKYDVFTISDEVICGFGRLGTAFGCERLNFVPNAISVAKALSSAYLPIAGVMIPEVMYQALVSESKKIGAFGHGFTYGGHPVSAAVALKAIEIYARDRIFERAAKLAPQFQARLDALNNHELVGEARGLGLIGGVELVANKKTREAFAPAHGVGPRAVRFAEDEGLIVRAVMGDVLTLCPPLIITAAEIDDLFDRLGRALNKTLDWVRRERLDQA
jgi:4-aminobutyrate--pyruvate transaminase